MNYELKLCYTDGVANHVRNIVFDASGEIQALRHSLAIVKYYCNVKLLPVLSIMISVWHPAEINEEGKIINKTEKPFFKWNMRNMNAIEEFISRYK